MHRYQPKRRGNLLLNKWLLLLAGTALLALFVAGALYVRYESLLTPVSESQKNQLFVIKPGSGVNEIAASLEQQELIKSASAMELYVKIHRLSGKFQAGSYELSPSLGTKSIVGTLTKGRTSEVLVTILPGRRIDQVRADLINAGFPPEEVDIALDPNLYKDIPIMGIKPQGILTLEGMLWPESFKKDAATTAQDIIRKSLVLMDEKFTTQLKNTYASMNLTPYQALILASMIEQEVSKPEDRPKVAQVFLLRLQKGMKLGSDPTAKYGAIVAGFEPSLTYDSAYNTLLRSEMPPTPISTVSASALDALANPAKSDWLYFVTGDDGTTHFSKTLEQHEAYTRQYCTKLCGR